MKKILMTMVTAALLGGCAEKPDDVEALYQKAVGFADKEDYVSAVKYGRLAADQGHAEAQFGLGICYANGYGVKKDPAEAAKW